MTAPDPQTVREIARKHIRSGWGGDIGTTIVKHLGNGVLGDEEYVDWYHAVVQAWRVELRALSWPDEQRPADTVSGEQLEVVWLTQDDEGNLGVWRNPDNARQWTVRDRTAETPGTYEWVNDADGTHELLLRNDEPTGLTLRMALVADAAPTPVSGEQQDGAGEEACVCGDPNCMPYWRPVHRQMNELRLRSDRVAADFTKAMIEEICEERTRAEQAEAERDALTARVAELEAELTELLSYDGSVDLMDGSGA